MLQSRYLFKLLPAALIFFCVHAVGFGIGSIGRIAPQGAVTHPKRESLAATYRREAGVREQGANEGKRVEEYLKYVELEKGQPWCAAFVCWALGKAELKNPRSGWSPRLFPVTKVIWERSRQLRVNLPGQRTDNVPQQADVFGIYFPGKGRIAHCGFIDQWSESGSSKKVGESSVNISEPEHKEGDIPYTSKLTS